MSYNTTQQIYINNIQVTVSYTPEHNGFSIENAKAITQNDEKHIWKPVTKDGKPKESEEKSEKVLSTTKKAETTAVTGGQSKWGDGTILVLK